jgi:hypothetical protein
MRMRPALALVLATGTAAAAPILKQARDLDGDGKPETVELDDSGELRIGNQKLAVGAAKAATIGVSQFKGNPIVVVDTGKEAVLLSLRGGTWRELLRTPVGGVGIDADYSIAIAATPQGIYRYQTRPGALRCDGKPAYLFAEGFNGTKFQRLSKLPIDIKEGASVIAARLDTGAASESLLYKARFASHQPGASDASALGIPAELDDGKPATAWREDLTASAGEGQFFTFVPRFAGAKATQLRIVPGAQKGTNRPQRLGIVSSSGAWHIEIPDAHKEKDPPNSAYIADLPSPIDGCVTVIIESTYGPDRGTTAIAELAVYAEGERGAGASAANGASGGDMLLARVVAEGTDGATSAAQALSRRGAAGAAAIDAELARARDAAARGRLVRAAIGLRDPAAGPVLARAIAEEWVSGPDLVAAVRALQGLGAGTELAALAKKSGTPLEARVAAARALQPTVDTERDLLVTLGGHGPRDVRQAVIERLSELPVDKLLTLVKPDLDPAIAGDVWRAVTRRAHAKADERSAALAAMLAALPAATDYEARYRLVDGIAATGDAAALKTLAATLASYPLDASTSAYKQVAARAIAVNPRNEATDLLVSFTRDRDPGVRLAALSALTSATGTAPGPWHGDAGVDGIDRVIQTLLATDTWPEVRRNAAQALGARCSRPGPAASLADAVRKDADVAVRGDALAGLVDCRAAGVAELLAKLWDDGKAPVDLRGRAVDLVATLGDKTLAAKLVKKYTQWRSAAIESEEALALAQRAAYTLGRMAPPGAADALAAALDDSAFPEIVGSAATGLGLLGPACPAAAKKKLSSLAASDEEPQVVSAAKRAFDLCGKR